MGGLLRLVLDVVVTALGLWAVTALVPGISILPPEGTVYGDGQYDHALMFLGVAVVFLLVNAVIGPILRTLGAPVTCVTLGLFALVINAMVLWLTGWVSAQLGLGMIIDGFVPALIGAVVLAVVRGVLGLLTGGLRRG